MGSLSRQHFIYRLFQPKHPPLTIFRVTNFRGGVFRSLLKKTWFYMTNRIKNEKERCQKWRWQNRTHRILIDMTIKLIRIWVCSQTFHNSKYTTRYFLRWKVFTKIRKICQKSVAYFFFTLVSLVSLPVGSIVKWRRYSIKAIQVLLCKKALWNFLLLHFKRNNRRTLAH